MRLRVYNLLPCSRSAAPRIVDSKPFWCQEQCFGTIVLTLKKCPVYWWAVSLRWGEMSQSEQSIHGSWPPRLFGKLASYRRSWLGLVRSRRRDCQLNLLVLFSKNPAWSKRESSAGSKRTVSCLVAWHTQRQYQSTAPSFWRAGRVAWSSCWNIHGGDATASNPSFKVILVPPLFPRATNSKRPAKK